MFCHLLLSLLNRTKPSLAGEWYLIPRLLNLWYASLHPWASKVYLHTDTEGHTHNKKPVWGTSMLASGVCLSPCKALNLQGKTKWRSPRRRTHTQYCTHGHNTTIRGVYGWHCGVTSPSSGTFLGFLSKTEPETVSLKRVLLKLAAYTHTNRNTRITVDFKQNSEQVFSPVSRDNEY